jgi:hypothetical protein
MAAQQRFLFLAMNERHKSCGAHRKSDRGIGPGQAVPPEQSEGHRSDVAASFAKPTSPHVIPGDKLDHDHTSAGR